MLYPVLPHLPLLMRPQAQVTPRLARANQSKLGFLIFRKIRIRARLIHLAAEQSARARKTSALMAYGRKHDSVSRGRIPNELVPGAPEGTLAFGRFEHDQMSFRWIHAAASCLLRDLVTDCKNRDSCYTALRPARRGGSGLKESICHPAHAPAAR